MIYKLQQEILEATSPYVFMLQSDLEYSKLRSGVEFHFKNLQDKRLFMEINTKKITITYRSCDYYTLVVGLKKGFDLLTPRFARPFDLENHINKEENKEKAKKAFNIATKKFTSCDYSIPYVLNKTIGTDCNIFGYRHNKVKGDCEEKYKNYVMFEDAWKQREYEEEVFPGEEPWKLWENTLEIPFAIGYYFTHVFGADGVDVQ